MIAVKDRHRISIRAKKDGLEPTLIAKISIPAKTQCHQTRLADGNKFVIENGWVLRGLTAMVRWNPRASAIKQWSWGPIRCFQDQIPRGWKSCYGFRNGLMTSRRPSAEVAADPPGGGGQTNSQAKNTTWIIVLGKFWPIGILQLRVTVPPHFREIPTVALRLCDTFRSLKKEKTSTDFVAPILQQRFHGVTTPSQYE